MVARARACGVRAHVCVRESVCAFVCVCVCYCQVAVTKNSQTYFCKHPTFINIHVTKRYMYSSTTTSK